MPRHARKWGQGRQKTSAMPQQAKTWGIAGTERAIVPQREKIKKVRENMFVNYEGIRKRIEFLENEIKRVSLICQRKNIMSM